MKFYFSGRTAFIFGGTCCIGLSLARNMIRNNIFPVLSYRNEEGRLKIDTNLSDISGKYLSVYIDANEKKSINKLFDTPEYKEKEIDFFVDLAHTDFESYIASADDDKIYTYFVQNLCFRTILVKKIARIMLKNKRGKMIYISSAAAIRPNHGQGFYRASKLASEAIYRSIGIEMANKGITTVSLRPGYVNTGRGSKYIKTEVNNIIKKIPSKKLITAKQTAETIMFYLSDSAQGFNAVEITMDGGFTAGK